jgi:hypothetical protein
MEWKLKKLKLKEKLEEIVWVGFLTLWIIGGVWGVVHGIVAADFRSFIIGCALLLVLFCLWRVGK